jgi:hypothetical protein
MGGIMIDERAAEILEQERRFWDAMQRKNPADTGQMTHDHCIVVGAQGVSKIDGKTMAKLTAEGEWVLDRFTIDENNAQINFVTEDIAIVGYTVRERVTVQGKELDIEAHDASVWVRRDGRWTCALHTESLAGDPFGRDRVKQSKATPQH